MVTIEEKGLNIKYTYIHRLSNRCSKMPTRTISITEEAYERLKVMKEKNESFTDVINRVTGKRSLLELAGILSEEDVDKMEEFIKKSRLASRKRMDEIIKKLK